MESVVLLSLSLTCTDFTHCPGVFVVYLEQVNISWDENSLIFRRGNLFKYH